MADVSNDPEELQLPAARGVSYEVVPGIEQLNISEIAPKDKKKKRKHYGYVTELSVAVNILSRLPIISDIISCEAVQWGERPTYISEQIKEGSYLRVIPWNVMSPTQVFVNLFEYWNAFEEYQTSIQPRVQCLSKVPQFLPQEEMLVPGLIMMAWCSVTDGTTEWHRVQVISADIGPSFNVNVRFLDFGGTCEIQKIENLSYMRRDFLHEFPVQAIEIKIYFEGYGRRIVHWTEEGQELLIKALDGKPTIGVHFIKKSQHGDPDKDLAWGKDIVWVTSINILADANCEGHSAVPEDVGVINDYMTVDIEREMARRKVRDDRKKKRVLPIAGEAAEASSSSTEQQRYLQAQDQFELSLNRLLFHGELVTRVESAVSSKAFEDFIVNTRNPGAAAPEDNN